MSPQIRAFTIKGLHGELAVRIPIRDNRLLLVGVNGLGKTTVMTMLYLTLSRQWTRLLAYTFDSVSLSFGGPDIVITRKALEVAKLARLPEKALLRMLPASVANRVELTPDLLQTLLHSANNPRQMRRLADEFDIPVHVIEMLAHRYGSQLPLLQDNEPLKKADESIRTLVGSQVVYLPTYRRIEKDLKAIFPELDEDIRRFHRHRFHEGREGPPPAHLELVEFGMEDVDERIRRVMIDLKESARAQLNNLTGSYLRDVIRGDALRVRLTDLAGLDDRAVTKILGRVEEHTLNEADKKTLRTVIRQIQEGTSAEVQDKYLAHFFSKLVEVAKALTEREASAVKFVEVCGRYLKGKAVTYDDRKYEISIRLDSGRPIALRDLSSGEKQIVSLFSHLYLSSVQSFSVLIDEPELSLSMEWQKRLLPDIVESGRCTFLAAATHSPFIFDNEMDGLALDLGSCISGARA